MIEILCWVIPSRLEKDDEAMVFGDHAKTLREFETILAKEEYAKTMAYEKKEKDDGK